MLNEDDCKKSIIVAMVLLFEKLRSSYNLTNGSRIIHYLDIENLTTVFSIIEKMIFTQVTSALLCITR